MRGEARTPEPCISPPTSYLAASPAPAEGACTTRGAKITRGWEPIRAVHTMAPSGTTGRSQVTPQMGAVRGLGQEGHHRQLLHLTSRRRLLEQLVPAAQSFETACQALLLRLSPSEQLLAELRLGPKGLEESMPYLQVWPRLGVGVRGMSQAQRLCLFTGGV